MSNVMKKNGDIQETHVRYDSFSSDEEKRMLYEARMKLIRDYNNGYSYGKEDGVIFDKQHVLIRQLNRKFGLKEEDRTFILSINAPEKLDSALDEIIIAEKLDQVLSKLKENQQK